MTDATAADRPRQLVSDADHIQLSRLVTEITWRIDHRQADTIDELFAHDGVLNIGERNLEGRQQIKEWGTTVVDAYPGIRHAVSNVRFVADGNDAADGVALVTAYLADDGTATTIPFQVGEDIDRFVRTAEGWRFTSRRWNTLFTR
jgi:SnoaL-like protein